MKLIIDISEDDYKEVKEDTYSGTPFENRVFSAIANGTPLPTGNWVDHHSPEAKKCMQYMSECSVCGKMICNRYNIYRNFCTNCGAKMEEEQKTT